MIEKTDFDLFSPRYLFNVIQIKYYSKYIIAAMIISYFVYCIFQVIYRELYVIKYSNILRAQILAFSLKRLMIFDAWNWNRWLARGISSTPSARKPIAQDFYPISRSYEISKNVMSLAVERQLLSSKWISIESDSLKPFSERNVSGIVSLCARLILCIFNKNIFNSR